MGWNDHLGDDELANLPPEAFGRFNVDGPFDPDNFWLEHSASEEEQKIAMRAWFHARYCDPAHETPYISREGGYQFIWGGPYDPADELSDRFANFVNDEIIQEIIEEMYDEVGDQWAPINYGPPDDYEYDERFDFQLLTRSEALDRLKERLKHAQLVLTLEGDEIAKHLAVNLVFGAAIAALEAFLWETVEYCVEHEEDAIRNIVTNIQTFRDQPLKLGEIFDKYDKLKEIVKGYLQNLVWHRWEKVAPLFKFGLRIQPPSFNPFEEALIKRHDIVHRSGHDISGNPITVTPEEIQELCKKIEEFATEIYTKLAARNEQF